LIIFLCRVCGFGHLLSLPTSPLCSYTGSSPIHVASHLSGSRLFVPHCTSSPRFAARTTHWAPRDWRVPDKSPLSCGDAASHCPLLDMQCCRSSASGLRFYYSLHSYQAEYLTYLALCKLAIRSSPSRTLLVAPFICLLAWRIITLACKLGAACEKARRESLVGKAPPAPPTPIYLAAHDLDVG
jgi:hypothetical protein